MIANSAPAALPQLPSNPFMRVLAHIPLPGRIRFTLGAISCPSSAPLDRDRISSGVPAHKFDDAVHVSETDFLPTLKPKAATRYRVSIKALMRSFAGVPVSEIAKSNLMQFISERRAVGVQGSTIRRDLACLSLILRLAVARGWIQYNPVRDLDLRQLLDAPPRNRCLTQDEQARLIQYAADYLKQIISFAIETGLTLGEQTTLEWKDVDLPRGELRLKADKTSRPRVVPLTSRALQILREPRRHWTSTYVFCRPDGLPYSRFTRGLASAAKRAGLEHVRWIDLRRTCGCRLLEQGVDIYKVSNWLGHRSVAVTQRLYAFRAAEGTPGAQPAAGHAQETPP